MELGAYVSIAVMIIIFFTLFIIAFVWWRRRRFTRERFAFVSFSALLGISSLSIITLAAPKAPWEIVIHLLANLLGIQYEPKETGLTAFMFTLAVLGLVYLTVRTLYLGWDGCVSERQSELEKRKQTTTLTLDALTELKRLLLLQGPLEIYSPDTQLKYEKLVTPTPSPLSWHHQVRDLLMLGSSSLYFDLESNWHDKEDAWFGLNKKSGNRQAVFCTLDYPDDRRIDKFICYIKSLCKKYPEINDFPDGVELTIACKNETPGSMIEIDGISLRIIDEKRLIEALVDFTYYYHKLETRYKADTLPESSLSLQNVYTPPFVSDFEKTKEAFELETYLSRWLEESGQRQIALLGEYGMGKSSLALSFAHKLCCTSDFASKRVPILIELRGMSPRNLSPLQILAIWAQPYNINPNALLKVIESGNALIILDGFDEMELVGDPEQRLEHFRSLWGLSFPKNKMLITGRPNLFLDDRELKAALGIADPTGGGAYAEAVLLLPFNRGQISSALRSATDEVKYDILSLSDSDIKFFDLISRPSLLYIVSQLWKRSGIDTVSEINSAVLIQRFIQYSLERQTKKALEGEKFMILNSSERAHFMSGLAAYMFSKDMPNQIHRREMGAAIALLYEKLPETVSTNVGAHKSEPSRPLAMRLKDRNNILELIEDDVRSCGLIVMDPTRTGSFRFAHKSFFEYIVAEVLVNSSHDIEQYISAHTIKQATELSLFDLNNSDEAISFFAELIITKKGIKAEANNQAKIEEFRKVIFESNSFMDWLVSFYGKSMMKYPWMANKSILVIIMLIMFLGLFALQLMYISSLGSQGSKYIMIISIFIIFTLLLLPSGDFGTLARRKLLILIRCTDAIGITPKPLRKLLKKNTKDKIVDKENAQIKTNNSR